MSQPESKLSRKIMAELKSRGAFIFKIHGGPMMMSGLPDVCGVWRGRFIAVETKMPGHRDNTSLIQRRRHEEIRAAGGIVVVATSVAEAVNGIIRAMRDDA